MLKKEKKCSWISPYIQSCTKSEWGLFWVETHPPARFCGKPVSNSCVVFLTDQAANKQTHAV